VLTGALRGWAGRRSCSGGAEPAAELGAAPARGVEPRRPREVDGRSGAGAMRPRWRRMGVGVADATPTGALGGAVSHRRGSCVPARKTRRPKREIA